MKKIRVLHFAPYFPPHKGGLETHAEEWVNAWIDAGYGEVITITSSIGQNGEQHTPHHNLIPLESFEIVPHFPVPKFWKTKFWNTMRGLKEEKPDIVITRTRFFLLSFIGGMYAKFTGTPWIHIEHGSGSVETDRFLVKVFSRVFDATLGWWIIRFSDKVIGISEACKLFVESFGRKDKIPVIYRGVDFIPSEKMRNEREDTQKNQISFIGRLTYLKGAHILIEALHKMEGRKTWHCNIVGDGEERKKLEDRVRELHLEKNISFLGMLSRKDIAEKILPETDIFVNPSFQEGLPSVVLEALIARCRVIATDVGGTGEISDKEDFTLIPRNDSDALFVALKMAIGDYENNRGLSYNLIKSRFNWGENIKAYYTIISELVDS